MRILAFILVLLNVAGSVSQTRSELEAQRSNTLKEIAETENILGDVRKSKSESLETYSLIDKKISLRNTLIVNLTQELKKVDKNISELEAQIGMLNSDIKKIKAEYAKLIYSAYLTRNKDQYLIFILGAEDINQSYRRVKYIKEYSEYRLRQVRSMNSVQHDLGNTLVKLEKQKKDKMQLLGIQQRENRTLKSELNEKTRLLSNLKNREKELVSKLREKNKNVERLNSAIERMIKAEVKKRSSKPSDSKSNLTTDDLVLSSSFKENKGKLPWPTDKGVITGFFGEHEHPIYKNVKLPNNGIDISTNAGSSVKAIFDGEVRYVVPMLGANYAVLIRHGNFFTLYSNVIDVKVKTGDKVKTKQVIGRVFTDDASKSTVLHLELWEELNKLDPQAWLYKN
jgi:septal ring factor EnvC (AmiA/AmiB activator)